MDLGNLDWRVELRELLGEGGMGEVHAAWDRSLARPVAVKFVRGADPRAAERLLLEARLQARVEHPHVVRVFEVGALAGRPCILFQLVRGRTLADRAAELPLADRVELVRQAATGLHAAHLQGLVHRDVKPGNVLVEEGEEGARSALVTDFGLAHAEEGGLTRTGILPGTLDFMAPEQLAGGGPVDFRSDVYALGATLYAVLSGRPPFRIPSARPEGSGEEQVRLLRRILDEEAPPLRSVAPAVPRELALVARTAMEKEPGERYPSAEAFAEDLARFQRGEPVRAQPPTVAERALKWSRRNRAASRAIAAAAAVLLAAGGFTLWLSRQAGRDALEAARLGAVAASLESRMRMEYLSPPHDLRPALAAVKAEVEGLRPLAARRGGGPASFALGKGLELLGDLDAARAAYERAWSLGFRTSQTAEGLGLALARAFARERRQALESLAVEARDRRIAALRAELLEPARRALESADRRGARGAWLDASVAEAAGETELARRRAGEALAADPELYEARLLEGAAFVQDGVDLLDGGQYPEAGAALDRALSALEETLAVARSDVRVLRSIAEVHHWRAMVRERRGEDVTAEAEQALAWAERVRAVDPDDPWVPYLRGMVRSTQGRYAGMTGKGDALPLLQEAAADLQRARSLRPRDAETLRQLLATLYQVAFLKHQRGGRAAEEAEEGLRVYRAALEVAPAHAAIHHQGLLVLLERARDLRQAGQASPEAFEEAVAAGEEALRLQARGHAAVQQGLVSAIVDLGQERWLRGQDPRPDLARGLARAEELVRESASLSSLTRALWALGSAGQVYLAMGEDFAGPSARAQEIAEQARLLKPEHPFLQVLKGEMSLVEARRRLNAGQDAGPALDEAERWIVLASKPLGDRATVRDDLAYLPLYRARAVAAAGGDPAALLARAERALLGMAAREGEKLRGLSGLALVAIERSARARRQGGTGEAEARAGLAFTARALAEDATEPQLWVLQARVQGLAGSRAESRASLDRAYALQPLVRGGREARAAEAELAAPARAR